MWEKTRTDAAGLRFNGGKIKYTKLYKQPSIWRVSVKEETSIMREQRRWRDSTVSGSYSILLFRRLMKWDNSRVKQRGSSYKLLKCDSETLRHAGGILKLTVMLDFLKRESSSFTTGSWRRSDLTEFIFRQIDNSTTTSIQVSLTLTLSLFLIIEYLKIINQLLL